MYTKSELLTHLHELADELERTPTAKDMRAADDRPNVKTYRNQFGSWNAAVEEAELEPNQKHPSYDDDELLTHLQKLADKLGRTPTRRDMNAADARPSVTPYQNRFGSWNAALKEAELEPNHKNPSYDTDEMLRHLQELADKLGRTPTAKDMNNAAAYHPSASAYKHRFGSWNAALKEAELEPNEKQASFDTRELLTHLQELADELGHPPTLRDMQTADERPSASTYERHFGSWNDALEHAELEPNRKQRRPYDDNELLRHVQELADELKRTPTARDMNTADDRPSAPTYQNRFGSWNAALKEAELDAHHG